MTVVRVPKCGTQKESVLCVYMRGKRGQCLLRPIKVETGQISCQQAAHATIRSDIYFSNMGLRGQIHILGQRWPGQIPLFVSPHLVQALHFLYIVLLSHQIKPYFF